MYATRLLTATALGLVLAGAALAQTAQPQAPQIDRTALCKERDAHLAGKLAYAEAKLGLSEAQKAGFKKLTDTITAAHESTRKLCLDQAAQPEPTALPGRLERMQKSLEARTESMRKVVPAITQFYGTLTPEQQKIADGLMSHRGHGHMGHGHTGYGQMGYGMMGGQMGSGMGGMMGR
jgi:hypothetical protein